MLKESKRKPNKIWVDKGSEFYNNSFKKWLQDNIVMYSTNNEGKSVIAQRFIRTLKNKIYKYMTSISKNVYIDKLDDIVKKYNNTYHTSIKMKPVDVKDNTYIDFKFRIEKVLKKKGDKLYVKWKAYDNSLIVGLIKKTLYKMSQYFRKPYEPFGGDINFTVDLSNYATKDDIKNITHVDTSSFALKTNLANLKTEVDKLDIDKLATVPVDLSKLSNIVKNDVVKKTDYNKLVTKVDNIDTSGLVKKTDYNTKITEIEDEIPDNSSFVKKTDYNTKITEIEDKILDISGLATKTVLTTVENKIPSINNLATKTALTTVENKILSISGLVKKTIQY